MRHARLWLTKAYYCLYGWPHVTQHIARIMAAQYKTRNLWGADAEPTIGPGLALKCKDKRNFITHRRAPALVV